MIGKNITEYNVDLHHLLFTATGCEFAYCPECNDTFLLKAQTTSLIKL